MPGLVDLERLDLVSCLRGEIQQMLGRQQKVKMFVCDLLEEHPGENAVGVLFVSEADTGEESAPLPAGPVSGGSGQRRNGSGSVQDQQVILVGKPREFQQFLNKEGPFYNQEFMLDLEFNYGTEICTVHNINLPSHLRNSGLGSAIIKKTEDLARAMGMKTVCVPSEHRATAFWLKNGYRFEIPGEKIFYEKNKDKTNLYVAYDLRKIISTGITSL